MNGLYELFVIGALEREESAEIAQHLGDACPYCSVRVEEAVAVSAAFSGMAEPAPLPAGLRKRVLASIRPQRESRNWLYAALALGAVCAALVIFAYWSSSALESSRNEIAEITAQRDQLRSALAILSRNETRAVRFGLADNQPHGRVFVNPQRGLVFVGSQLPSLRNEQTFELWLIPKTGAPEPAGLFRPNADGNVVSLRTTPIDTAQIQAVAVTVEPQGGSSAPTTKPILAVPLA